MTNIESDWNEAHSIQRTRDEGDIVAGRTFYLIIDLEELEFASKQPSLLKRDIVRPSFSLNRKCFLTFLKNPGHKKVE